MSRITNHRTRGPNNRFVIPDDSDGVKMTKLQVILMGWNEPQYKIAAALGFAPSRLSEYAHGAQIPPHHLIAICQYFRRDPDDVIGWTDV